MILDSSFLVSFFRQCDENHGRAVALADRHDSEEKILPEPIYYETLTVINYKDGIAAAKEASDYLASNQQIRIHVLSEEEKEGMLADFFAHEKQLSVEDASVIHLARAKACKVLAFDERIIKATRK
jgi:predicted nucleic acid-binding protein